MRESAVRSVMHVLRRASDWQEGQDYLANHAVFRPWIDAQCVDDMAAISLCQSIIREAEERLGDELPY
jgi:hypothetical protein